MPTPTNQVRIRECKLCGCTDDRGCPEGCSWVAPDVDVCSSCAEDYGLIGAEECKEFLQELDI